MSDPQYPPPPPQDPGYGQPPSGSQYGQQPGQQHGQQYGQPYGESYGYDKGPGRGRRPGTVVAGCVMTWIGGAFGVLLGIGIAAASSSEEFKREAGIPSSAEDFLVALGIGLLVMSVLAIVLAVFAFRGSNGAAITLLVLAGVYFLLALANLASGGGRGLFGPLWSLVAAILIFTGVRKWRAGRT